MARPMPLDSLNLIFILLVGSQNNIAKFDAKYQHQQEKNGYDHWAGSMIGFFLERLVIGACLV